MDLTFPYFCDSIMFTEDIHMKVVKSTDISVLDVSVSLIQSG
jgi:hypothetical protein